MTEHKYTDEEVIKALECCYTNDSNDCYKCPYTAESTAEMFCDKKLTRDALALINRQKAEIADLQDGIKCEEETNKHLSGEHLTLMKECYGLKAEIVRLEAETKRLKDMFEDNETQRSYTINMLGEHLDKAKSEIAFWMDAAANAKKEAVKEFADRMKERMNDLARIDNGGTYLFLVGKKFIDGLVKEFTEEKT